MSSAATMISDWFVGADFLLGEGAEGIDTYGTVVREPLFLMDAWWRTQYYAWLSPPLYLDNASTSRSFGFSDACHTDSSAGFDLPIGE